MNHVLVEVVKNISIVVGGDEMLMLERYENDIKNILSSLAELGDSL